MSERPTLRSVPWSPVPEEDVDLQFGKYNVIKGQEPYNARTTGIRGRLIKADGTSADPHARLASARIRRAQVEMEWRESLNVLVKIDELIEGLERECDERPTERAPAP